MQCMHRIHSVPLVLFLELLVTSTFIGQIRSHFPQEIHFEESTVTRKRAKKDIGFRNTVTGQIYLQKARLSLHRYARVMPTA